MSLIVLINGLNDSAESKAQRDSRRTHLLSTLVPDTEVKFFDFLDNEIEFLDHSYLRKRSRDIISSLQQWETARSKINSTPVAVVFLAHTIGATLVKQILLLALAHSSYQWLAFGAAGLHFFESPSFTEPGLWDRFLIQALAIGDIRGPTPSQLFSVLPDALSKVEQEFASASQGFKIILHEEPQLRNYDDGRTRLWAFDKNDSSLHEVVQGIREDFRRKTIGMQKGFQLLQRRLSPSTISLGRLKAMVTNTESTKWILTDPTYKTWMSSTAPAVLGIAGASGSGGTHVSSHVTSALTMVKEVSEILILSFNFARWDSRRNSEQAFLSSLIRQLLTLSPQLYRTVKTIAEILLTKSNFTCRQLLAILGSLLSRLDPHRKVFLVINAADQCLQPLEKELAYLLSTPSIAESLKIVVTTSTPLKLPENIPYHEISLSNVNVSDSIRGTVKQRVARIMILKPAWKDSKEAIVERLCAEGCTYLQVMLNLAMLERNYTPSTRRGIRQFLSNKVPQPQEIFKIAVGGLSQGGSETLLLNWVFHALRPLTVTELAVALTLTANKEVTGESIFFTICEEVSSTVVRDIVNSLAAIIKLVDDEVMPIHHTTRAYFEAEKGLLIPNFHELAATRSLAYLSACSGTSTAAPTGADDLSQPCGEIEVAKAFLDYAGTYWAEHYKLEASPTTALNNEVTRFLKSATDAFNDWVEKAEKVFQWPKDAINASDALLLATQLGFQPVVLQMIKDEEDKGALTPDRIVAALAASARTINDDVFHDLLKKVPPDSDLAPVLCVAAEYGHTEIVRLLMGRNDVVSSLSENKCRESKAPLLLAVENGHTATVEILLSHGYPITISEDLDQDGEVSSSRTNAIHLAAQLGDAETLLLLQRLRPDEFRSLVGSPNVDGKSPLQLCCIAGSLPAFDILFSVSEISDFQLHQLLCVAAELGHLAIVDRLLSVGASIVDRTEGTTTGPLPLAAENGHYAVVRRLLAEGEKLFTDTTDNMEATAPATLWKSQLSSSFGVSFNDNDHYDCRIVALLAPYRDTSGGNDGDAMGKAVYSGQLDTIKVLIDAGISIHVTRDDSSRYNWLIDRAISGNRPDSIRFLLDQGIAVQWDEIYSETSIHYAARLGHSQCVRELLKNATPEVVWRKNANNTTAFELAVETGDATVVEAFLDWKDGDALFEPHHMAHQRRPPRVLLMALRSCNLDLIRLLLNAGWTANAADSRSQDPPLHVAIEVGKDDIIELLLTGLTNPDVRNNKGETALHIAVQCKSVTSIKLLLNSNANPKLVDNEGLSPLHLAVKLKNKSLVAALLGFEADQLVDGEAHMIAENALPQKDNTRIPHQWSAGVDAEMGASGLTPLLMAIERDDLQIVRMLLKAGADPNGPSGSWGSLLNAALYKGQLAIIKALVDSGANTRIITRSFGGPLHILNFSEAFASDDSGLSQIRQIAHLLLGNGAQLDARDHGGGTPIMRAIFHGNMPYAELLLELGADVNTRDELGMTTMHYAASWASDELMKKLVRAVLHPCALDACDRSPLYRATLATAYDYQPEKFDIILETIPAEDRQSQLESALTASLKALSYGLFRKIIGVDGVNVNVPDRHGWTPLDIAIQSDSLSSEYEILQGMGATRGSMIKNPARFCACDMHYDNSMSQDGREAWIEGLPHDSPMYFGGAMRADHPIPPNKPTYFEVEIVELEPGNVVVVGLLAESSKLSTPVGTDYGTWGYPSDGGVLIEPLEGAPRYGTGQTVGVAVDMGKRTACFILDDVWKSPPFNIFGQLYPAVSFYSAAVGKSKVRINFGKDMGGTDFKYKLNDDWADAVAPGIKNGSEEALPESTAGEQLTAAERQ